MNKSKLFFTIFSIAIIINLLVNEFVFGKIEKCDYYLTKYQTVEDYVISSGIIEYKNKKTVKYNSPLVINEINIKAGDNVKKGDLLFSCSTANYASTEKPLTEEEIYQAYIDGDLSKLKNISSVQSGNLESEEVRIYSDCKGKVLSVNYNVGDKIPKNTAIAQIVTNNSMVISLDINETHINKVKNGQSVKITGKAFEGMDYSGTVSNIENEAVSTVTAIGKAVTVGVKITVDNPDKFLKSGYTAKCEIITDKKENSVVVPYDAVHSENDGKEYIYFYKNGFAKKRYIKTGEELAEGLEITDGIDKNEIILLSDNLYDNKRVNLKEE